MKIYQKHKSIIRLEVVDCLVNNYLTWKIHTCLCARLRIEKRKDICELCFVCYLCYSTQLGKQYMLLVNIIHYKQNKSYQAISSSVYTSLNTKTHLIRF